jgi:hypothetical protein
MRTKQVACDLCGEIMSKDDHPPDPSPVDFHLKQLLHRIDPLMWGDLNERDLREGDDIRFDICTNCLFEVVDTEEIKKRFESN